MVRDDELLMSDAVRFDKSGNPEELPAAVRKSVWAGASYLAESFQPLISTIVDRGVDGFLKCSECGAVNKWKGDPRVAEIGLNLMKDLLKMFAEKKPSGRELTPGDLKALFEQMTDDDLEALQELAGSAREVRSTKAKKARGGDASPPPEPP